MTNSCDVLGPLARSRAENAASLPPAHGVYSLGRDRTVLDEAPFQRVKSRARARRYPDFRIQALNVVVRSFDGDVEPARRFLRGEPGRNQLQNLGFPWG